ncbi:hypothetical protein SNE40_018494 [Patella caerulea]|uniref:Uncharacterized protein n=1 Tax=Patella caerulea TaxID=87958 RepID=A0AAN8P810_PATCE
MFLKCVSRQDSIMDTVRRKLVVVGDGECGKTCLLQRFVQDEYKEDGYLPTVYEVDVTQLYYNKHLVDLSLYDTAGQECYDRLRPFSYVDTDVVLVVFSIDNPDSLENVVNNWAPEVRHFCGKVPVILVGTKCDLRDQTVGDNNSVSSCRLIKEGPVKYKDGERVAREIGAVKYMESSAKLNIGVQDIFIEAIKSCFQRKKKWQTFRLSKKIKESIVLRKRCFDQSKRAVWYSTGS